MNEPLVKIPQKLYWIFISGFFGILALPLLDLPPWFFTPDWGKTMVFRFIFSLLLFLFVSYILLIKGFSISRFKQAISKPNRSNLHFYLLCALLGIYSLATLFSLDRSFSLWGDPIRAGGFVNFAFYIFFAFLLFLVIKPKDWAKIWDFTIIIGLLVALIGLFQYLSLFPNIFTPTPTQIPATIGGPSFLGIYVLLLLFLSLSFGLRDTRYLKKLFYFASSSFFLFVLIIVASQAAYVGFALAFLYFFFFYPRKMKKLKMIGGTLFLAAILTFFVINALPDSSFTQNHTIHNLTSWRVDESRISAWTVSLRALQDRPLLGYGPENFFIGFDRYYDPSLSGIERIPSSGIRSWWDRAHNIFLDIALEAGILALVVYLAFFAVLLWKLQRKKQQHSKNTIPAHGIQAALLGYFAANLFSFNNVPTYLISFLIIGYAFFIIHQQDKDEKRINAPGYIIRFSPKNIVPIGFLFILLIFFIWNFNAQPFWVNSRLNIAEAHIDKQQCDQAFAIMDNLRETQHTYLDQYVNSGYVSFLRNCARILPAQKIAFAQKGYDLLLENIAIRPSYTRNWIFLGGFTNTLIDAGQQELLAISPQRLGELRKEAHTYFQTALRISPGRQDTYVEWIKTDLITQEYETAEKKAHDCVNLNPLFPTCWWLLARSQIALGNISEAEISVKEALSYGYRTGSDQEDSEGLILQSLRVYIALDDLEAVAATYEKLVVLRPANYQYRASLAFTYRELGQNDKARSEALKILELTSDPTILENIDQFLNTL